MNELRSPDTGEAANRFVERTQERCLLIFCVIEVFIIAFGGGIFHSLAYYLGENFLLIPCAGFFALSLAGPHTARGKRRILFCAASVAWFGLLQLYHRGCGEETYPFAMYACGMLLAFPFGTAADKGLREKGIRLIEKFYMEGVMLLCIFSFLLKLGWLPKPLAVSYYWDCARLNASWGSNLGASLLLIGIGLALSAFFRSNGWRRAGYAGMVGVFFYFLALTNCRTSITAAGLLLAGCTALAIAGSAPRRATRAFAADPAGKPEGISGPTNGSGDKPTRSLGRILLAAAAFAAVLLASWSLAELLFQAHEDSLEARYQKLIADGAMPETVEEGGTLSISVQYLPSEERSWDEDGATLNGRTEIWAAALRALEDNPKILLVGRQDVGETITYYSFTPDTYPFPVEHTHNSWLEALFRAGILGLGSALYVTWIAVRGGIKIVFSGADMSKKCIAVLVAALLLCGFMEPFLFSGDTEYHCLNFFFLFAVGCLDSPQEEKWDTPANEKTRQPWRRTLACHFYSKGCGEE